MKTVGQFLAYHRKKKKISLARLSAKTKIKERFLQAVEEEEWQVLPSYAVTAGFVRNMAIAISANQETALALLRRDWAGEDLPAGKAGQKVAKRRIFFWQPRLTTTLALVAAGGAIAIYLAVQYINFSTPPPLHISGIERQDNYVEITGKTDKEASVLINSQAVLVDEAGNFKIKIKAQSGQVLKIESRSLSGKSRAKEITVP